MTAALPAARATALSKTFGAGTPSAVWAVRDANLTLLPGEMTLVMGPSGSGKTTLLSLMAGLLAPSDGVVELAGASLAGLSASQLTEVRLHKVGFVFQTFRLIEALSAVENVELPLHLAGVRRLASARRATELLGALGLGGRLHASPRSLSAGEKQRAAIARALANDPPLLLADEPTGSLDSRAGQHVIELLHATAREHGKAVLVVSHDARVRAYADRVLEMEDGLLHTSP